MNIVHYGDTFIAFDNGVILPFSEFSENRDLVRAATLDLAKLLCALCLERPETPPLDDIMKLAIETYKEDLPSIDDVETLPTPERSSESE